MLTESVLFAWIGNTDLDAADCRPGARQLNDMGPIGRVLGSRRLMRVVLLDDGHEGEKAGPCYEAWLRGQCLQGMDVKVLPCTIGGATDMTAIYRAACAILDRDSAAARQRFFLVSSGTPAMGCVWVLLASRYNATLLESSRERGLAEIALPLPEYEQVALPGLKLLWEQGRGVPHDSAARPLLAWLGNRDRKAVRDAGGRLGPVAGLLTQQHHDTVILLYEEDDRFCQESKDYCAWLQARLGDQAKVIPKPLNLNAKDLPTIYAATQSVVQQLRSERGDPPMDFLQSSGLTSMSIAWMLIATGYPKARLWETDTPKGSPAGTERVSQVVLPLLEA